MTQPAKTQEPSMEEILASIRRIIAGEPAKGLRDETSRMEGPDRQQGPRQEGPLHESPRVRGWPQEGPRLRTSPPESFRERMPAGTQAKDQVARDELARRDGARFESIWGEWDRPPQPVE